MRKILFTLFVMILFFMANSVFAQQVTWTSIGPGGGSDLISSAIQPDNADIIYIGGDIEGVRKTNDGGASWMTMNNGLCGGERPAGVYGIQELVIDPTNYQTIYACTWAGLFKSTNSAQNWQHIFQLPMEEEGIQVSYIAVDPDNGDILYIGIGDADANDGGEGTIYRSINGGTDWEFIDTGMPENAVIHSILIDPTTPQDNRTVFINTDNGVFRSVDDGDSWSAVNTNLPHLNTRRLVGRVVNNSFIIFLSIKSEGDPIDPSTFQGGIYKTTDNGDNWVCINGDLPVVPYEDPEDPPPFYDYWKFDVHPTNPDIIYAGTNFGGWDDLFGVHKTVDGGVHWVKVDTDINYGWLDSVWWADDNVMVLKIAPSNPDIVISGADCIHKSIDAGENWDQSYTVLTNGHWHGTGMELMVPFDVAFHPTDPDKFYVGYDDMGTWRSDDAGYSYARLDEVQLGDYDAANSIVIDPATGDVYVGRNRGFDDLDGLDEPYSIGQVWKSTDEGATWTYMTNGLPEGRPVLVMDTENSIIYCAVYGQGVYKTTNGGESWENISNGLGADAVYVWDISIAPTDTQTLYLALNTIEGLGGGIYKTTNGGENWIQLTNATVDDVLCIEVDPSNSNIVYAGVTDAYIWFETGGLYKSTDGGNSWDIVFDQPRIDAIAVHPDDPQTIFAASQQWWNIAPGQDSGFYRSTDGGNSWENITSNLGHTFILFARINPHNYEQIIVGTHGGGIWMGDLNSSIDDEKFLSSSSHLKLYQSYPNPFNPETNISFSILKDGKLNLSIYNIRGQKVTTLINEQIEKGKHTIIWSGIDSQNKPVNSGIYFYKIKVGNQEVIKSMILLK